MSWIQELISFFYFEEPNVSVVFWGSLLLCGISGLVGSFTFLRKQSLIGDVIAHSVLPGVCLAFMLGQEKNPIYLMVGAVITGWLSTVAVEYIVSRSKIKSDTAIALVLSVFFGLGVLLLTNIQHSGNAAQSGLDQFIFGRASAMNRMDVILFAVVGSLITALVLVFFRAFHLLSFDHEYSDSIGFPTDVLRLLLSIATVITVAMGVQAVGVVLMSALLITPAAAARFWTNNIRIMVILAVIISAFSGVLGSAVSYTYSGMPTGPWIVVVVSVIALLSAFTGTQKGLIKKYFIRRSNNKKILLENSIKPFFYLNNEFKENEAQSFERIKIKSGMESSILRSGLQLLLKNDLIIREGKKFLATEDGKREAIAIVRKHRLWELYISKYMHLKADHVHDDAEGIEHIITPEIERELEELLEFPDRDPHNKEIPSYE